MAEPKKIANHNTHPSHGPNDVRAARPAKETEKPLNHKHTVHKPTAAEAKLTKLNAPQNPADYL
jgi:hypothetical protein